MADEESLARTLNIQYRKLKKKKKKPPWGFFPKVRRSTLTPMHHLSDVRLYKFFLPITQFKD